MFRHVVCQAAAALLLCVSFTVPAFAAPAAGTAIDNQASADFLDGLNSTAATRLSNTVRAIVQGPRPAFALRLRVASGNVALDEEVTLALSAVNLGAQSNGIGIRVNGVARTAVLLTQAIPANTTLVSAQAAPGAQLLYHLRTAAPLVFVDTAPADLRQVDTIVYAYTTFPGGTEGEHTVTVKRDTGAVISIAAVAQVWFDDPVTAGPDVLPSNVVGVEFVREPPRIDFYTNESFSRIAGAAPETGPLHIEAIASICNQSADAVDTIRIVLKSMLVGDQEEFTAVETGPNTGIFRIPFTVLDEDSKTHGQNPSDGAMGTTRNDTLQASIGGCNGNTASTSVLVDPYGVVFDSASNEPVSGATVALIDIDGGANGGNAGGLARVFQDDGVTEAPNTVVTTADGAYRFPLVGASRYRLQVKPPLGFTVPSAIAPTALPAGRNIDSAGSYGQSFVVSAELGALRIDIPADSVEVGGLLIEKSASRKTAEIGDFVDYTVEIKNTAGGPLDGVTWRDTLPTGFGYQSGTLRRDGVRIEDPVRQGATLVGSLDTLADGASTQLRYRVKLGPGAQLGDGINRAYATATRPRARSNVAQARVRVEGGVFSDRGFVLGKIYADCNRDGEQNEGEPGVAGVRVWLEDGTYAITDGLGKYSFYGLAPRTHVAKIDPATVPAGATFEPLDQRNAGKGDSRFIDLKNGELARADFAIAQCDAGLRAELAARSAQMQQRGGEIEYGFDTPLTLDPSTIDPRSRPASGIVDAENRDPQALASAIATVEAAILAQRSLPEIAETLDNRPDFVGIADGIAVPATQVRVLVKGPSGMDATLIVNGEPVPQRQLGTRVTRAEKQLELVEFIGVELKPGDNTLAFEQRDSFGNTRAGKTIHVRAPGELQRIRIERARPQAQQDGGDSDGAIAIFLEDDKGLPVTTRTPVTLETDRGTWAVEDLDPATTGVQVFVGGGRAEYTLRASAHGESAAVRVSSGAVAATTRVDFLAPPRAMVAVGVVEGTLKLGSNSAGALVPARRQDGFEQQLQQFSYNDGRASARAAVFLKGKVKGDYLLTLGYDSDKDTRERLFRDIQPDQFYPVYGDASIKGFDAQSTQKLYVRVDKNKSWLLYGDFTTPGATPERSLTAYNRSLTGVREHYENERIRANVFASHDSTRQVIEEFAANGTSGPFLLRNSDLIENSEQVEVITRDRNQPGLIIDSVPLARFSDYELEPFSGRLLLRAPVPSVDADLNRKSIRVTYEVDSGGADFWVGGVDVQYRITDAITVGAVDVEDRDPADSAALRGVNATLAIGANAALIAEVARSEKDTIGAGAAQRIELKHENGDWQTRVYAGRADTDFYNPSATLSRGRSEGGAKISRRIDDHTRFVIDALHSGDRASGARRDGALAGFERAFAHNVKVEVGLRRTHEVAGDLDALDDGVVYPDTVFNPSNGAYPPTIADPIDPAAPGSSSDTTSVRLRVGAPVPGIAAASLYTELEQALDDADKQLAALGGEYRLNDKGRIYARHEFITSLSGPYAFDSAQRRDTTVFGIDNEYTKDGRAYSEYRARDAFTGREAEAAMGLKNQWTVAEGLRLSTNAERIRALAGSDDLGESTALGGGVEYTADPDWKGSGRLEWRNGSGSSGILNTLGLAWRIDERWTFLSRNIYNTVDSDGELAGDRWQDRFQAGFAYRDAATNRWNGLGRYEFRHEQDDTPLTGYWHRAHVLSLHSNTQLRRAVVLSGRYAAKYAIDRSDGIDTSGITQLVSGRLTWDFATRWDAGLQASRLFAPGSHENGLGAELGYQVHENLWLSLGYNIFGYYDRDLSDDSTDRGAYFRLRFKFDENSFEGFE
jgi:uncharacterized repeat protein (TIGR01451 family)